MRVCMWVISLVLIGKIHQDNKISFDSRDKSSSQRRSSWPVPELQWEASPGPPTMCLRYLPTIKKDWFQHAHLLIIMCWSSRNLVHVCAQSSDSSSYKSTAYHREVASEMTKAVIRAAAISYFSSDLLLSLWSAPRKLLADLSRALKGGVAQPGRSGVGVVA